MKAEARVTPAGTSFTGEIAEVLQESVTSILTHAVTLCRLSQEPVTIQLLHDVIMSAPSQEDITAKEPPKNIYTRVYRAGAEYQFKCRCAYEDGISPEMRAKIDRSDEAATEEYIAGMEKLPEPLEFRRADRFFGLDYAPLDASMRHMLNLAAAGVLLLWLREPIFSSLCIDPKAASSKTLEQKMATVLNPVNLEHLIAKN